MTSNSCLLLTHKRNPAGRDEHRQGDFHEYQKAFFSGFKQLFLHGPALRTDGESLILDWVGRLPLDENTPDVEIYRFLAGGALRLLVSASGPMQRVLRGSEYWAGISNT